MILHVNFLLNFLLNLRYTGPAQKAENFTISQCSKTEVGPRSIETQLRIRNQVTILLKHDNIYSLWL